MKAFITCKYIHTYMHASQGTPHNKGLLADNGLKFYDLEEGAGSEISAGDKVTVCIHLPHLSSAPAVTSSLILTYGRGHLVL